MPGFAKQIIDFSLTLAKHVLLNRDEINYTISTTGVYFALAMIQAGAKNKSRSEIEKLLGVDFSSLINNHDSPVFIAMKEIYEKLNLSAEFLTNLFTSVNLNRSYVELLGGMFEITGEYLSFDDPSIAVNKINRWVKDHTHGRVAELLKESNITRETIMVWASTIYFSGVWNYSFSEKLTKDAEFTLESGKTVTVPFMKRKGKAKIYDDKNDRFRALSMDFASGNYAGVFLLPKEHTNLKEFISTFKAADITKIIDRNQTRDINIKVPKFKVDRKTKVKKILRALGVTSIFDKNKSDLSNITEFQLWVDDIFHRSMVKISEKGVIGASGTDTDNSVITPTSTLVFHANRPFIFLIIDQEAGIPIFINAMYDPSKS